jgi:hypothetical protein
MVNWWARCACMHDDRKLDEGSSAPCSSNALRQLSNAISCRLGLRSSPETKKVQIDSSSLNVRPRAQVMVSNEAIKGFEGHLSYITADSLEPNREDPRWGTSVTAGRSLKALVISHAAVVPPAFSVQRSALSPLPNWPKQPEQWGKQRLQ